MQTTTADRIVLADNEVVLVKFCFTNPKYIPYGLTSIDRKSERELIARRMRALGTSDETAVRGFEVINNAQQVQAAMLRRGLASNGFHLVDGHVWQKRQPQRTTKHMVVLSYRRLKEDEVSPEIPASAVDDIRALATQAVWTCHVWQNPNGVVAVDFVQRQPGVTAKGALVTRNGDLLLTTVVTQVEEGEE